MCFWSVVNFNRIKKSYWPYLNNPTEIIWTGPHAHSGAGLSNCRAVPITGKEYWRQVCCPSRWVTEYQPFVNSQAKVVLWSHIMRAPGSKLSQNSTRFALFQVEWTWSRKVLAWAKSPMSSSPPQVVWSTIWRTPRGSISGLSTVTIFFCLPFPHIISLQLWDPCTRQGWIWVFQWRALISFSKSPSLSNTEMRWRSNGTHVRESVFLNKQSKICHWGQNHPLEYCQEKANRNKWLANICLYLRALKYLVMDEADRILNMDFEVEVDKILGCLPKEGRRNMLFSATMTKKVAKLQRASLSGLITNSFLFS